MRDENESNVYDKDRLGTAKERDRLNYKTLLQSHLGMCYSSIGRTSFGRNVYQLFRALYFNVHGLDFKTRLSKSKKELDEELKNVLTIMAIKNPGHWYHPIKKQVMLIKPMEQYNLALLQTCVDIMAESNLLIESRDFLEEGFER